MAVQPVDRTFKDRDPYVIGCDLTGEHLAHVARWASRISSALGIDPPDGDGMSPEQEDDASWRGPMMGAPAVSHQRYGRPPLLP